MISSFIIALIVFIVDQITKVLIYGTTARSIIGNLLWFESTLNTGVAFSMFKDSSNVFIVISSIASLVLIFLIANNKIVDNKNEKICLGFILGGTVGNLIDRILFGGVRDFIYLKFIDFAIFNIADMAVSFGAGFLCFFIIYYEWQSYKKEKLEKEKNAENKNLDENIQNENLEKDNSLVNFDNQKEDDFVENTKNKSKNDIIKIDVNENINNIEDKK